MRVVDSDTAAPGPVWPPHPSLVRAPQYLGRLHDYARTQALAVRRMRLHLIPEVRARVAAEVAARLDDVGVRCGE